MEVHIAGLDEHLDRLVTRKVEEALAGHPQADPWLSSVEAAEYLGIARSTLYDLLNDGVLPKHGEPKSKVRLRRSELDAYAEGRIKDHSKGARRGA